MTTETIFALSSGLGRAGIAVLRVSGPATRVIVEKITGKVPQPRRAELLRFIDPASGDAIDRGLVLFFPGPTSFTGEDCAEFHCHGGPAVVAAMLRALGQFDATRLAEAGEFARRAFDNGKFDLTEIEGLADLIAAETEAQRRQALRQNEGGLARQAEDWRRALREAMAFIEAEIDFGDEGDVAADLRGTVATLIATVRTDLQKALAAATAGERLRDGLMVVIAGLPNAGKSTLINALVRREVAIVTSLPGTTRDAIEVHLDLAGLPLTIVDTAGLRDTQDPIEEIGMARTRAKADRADLILWLSEASQPVAPALSADAPIWPIFTKTDLLNGQSLPSAEGLALSAATGTNLDHLVAKLTQFAQSATAGGEGALITRERHRQALTAALTALDQAQNETVTAAPELLAEDLRRAVRALESLIGRIDVESVLGEIFSRFCIGK